MHNASSRYEEPHRDVTKYENIAKEPKSEYVLLFMIQITYVNTMICVIDKRWGSGIRPNIIMYPIICHSVLNHDGGGCSGHVCSRTTQQ